MTEMVLFTCAFLTLITVSVAMFVSLVAATIVYSWWRKLQATRDHLPSMLQQRIDELAAKAIEPLRERLDERGRPSAEPNNQPSGTITLEEDYEEWMART